MLFYIALTIACFLAAAVCLWLFRTIVEIGKTAYRSTLPIGSLQKPAKGHWAAGAGSDTHRAQTNQPWDGVRRKPPSQLVARLTGESREPGGIGSTQVPWGWPGSSGLKQSNLGLIASSLENSAVVASVRGALQGGPSSQGDVGRSYRKERSAQSGEAPVRKGTKDNRRSKPWGW